MFLLLKLWRKILISDKMLFKRFLFVCLVNNTNEILYWSFSILQLRKHTLVAFLDYIISQKRKVTIQTEPVFILFFFSYSLDLSAYYFNAAKNSICFWTRRIVWLLWKTNISYSYHICSMYWLIAMNCKNINLNISKSICDTIFVPVLLILIRFSCISLYPF